MDRPSTTSLFDVYLRLRPANTYDTERFLSVEPASNAATHVTISPPVGDTRRRAIEKFAFTKVFQETAGQRDVYDGVGAAKIVEGVLGAKGREGRDGLLATLGVTGSGKSHTILGSRAQRGIVQLTLDLLFSQTEGHLAKIERWSSTEASLCEADVSEAQVLTAASFLDSVYGGETLAPSRAATPAFETSFLSTHMAGACKRQKPSPSALPDSPRIGDVSLEFDRDSEYAMVMSMYEVYNDRIFDLLVAPTTSATARNRRRPLLYKGTEKSPERKVVAGLRKVICSTLDEALMILETGLHERRVAGTGANATSSRSHGFFCIEVKKRRACSSPGHRAPGPWSASTLTIVDLAGSERARVAKTAGATLAEAGKINESLMYLGQCMQMQADSAASLGVTPALVPYRQCKLTELLFSNSFSSQRHHRPQKAVMIVTADPFGDYNATSQILRYSALAREVTVPRIPSGAQQAPMTAGQRGSNSGSYGRVSPTVLEGDLRQALEDISRLQDELDATQLRLREEMRRRQEAESSWRAAERRTEEIERELREEIWSEMQTRHEQDVRRWRTARDDDLDQQAAHIDAKLDILTRGIDVFIDEGADKENSNCCKMIDGNQDCISAARLHQPIDEIEKPRRLSQVLGAEGKHDKVARSPSKKIRLLKTDTWSSGSGFEF